MDTLSRTIEVIREVGSLDEIGPDDILYDNGLNSMHALSLLVELEEQYQIAIPDDEFISARTPRELNEMIGRLHRSAAA